MGRHIDEFDGVHGGYGVGHKNLEGRMSLELCMKKNYVCQIYELREEKKVTFKLGKNEADINFVLIRKDFTKCEGNRWGVTACISGSRYR